MNWKDILTKYCQIRKTRSTTVGTLNEQTRIDWLEKTLQKLPEGSRILDAGAGEQPFKNFCSHLQYVSQDFAQYHPTELNSGLQMEKWDYGKLDIVSDVVAIPEADGSFDAIMCTEVFEHIINPLDAVKEFARLLKQDGYLVITAPFCSLTHFAPYHFYSGFNTFFYQSALSNNGFEIIEITANGNYFEYLAQEINRLPHIAKQYGNTEPNKKEMETIEQLKGLLQKLSKQNKASSELLCFGYHVLARKK